LWPVKNYVASTVVSGMSLPISRCCADGQTVVIPHREDECLDNGYESEDSDYEDSLEWVGGPASETQLDGREKVEQEPLSALTVGSFARCVQQRLRW
jgi:hypothetical protein